MRIMGIDPGTAIVGYGVIDADGHDCKMLDVGVIRTSKSLLLSQRLDLLYQDLSALIKKYDPDEMAIEQLFFSKNAKTAMSVSQARGVLILAAVHNNRPIFEYNPLQIKQGITGYGKASKDQVTKMVCLLLKLEQIPKPDDAADALAIAMCHANQMRSPWLGENQNTAI